MTLASRPFLKLIAQFLLSPASCSQVFLQSFPLRLPSHDTVPAIDPKVVVHQAGIAGWVPRAHLCSLADAGTQPVMCR